jgi:putative FmdB family regulatory protein
MPTYEYRCPQCGSDFEKFQKMSEPPVADCPSCGEPAERRMSAGAGLLFKGSGFYITDYRGEGYKKAAASDKGDGGGGDKAGSGEKAGAGDKGAASDSKPAEKASDSKPKAAAGGSRAE